MILAFLFPRSHPFFTGGKHKRKVKRIIDNRWKWWSLHFRDPIDNLTVPNKSCGLDNVICVGDGSMGMKSITPPTWSNRRRISSMKWSQGSSKETAARRARTEIASGGQQSFMAAVAKWVERETGFCFLFLFSKRGGCAPKCPKYYWCIANINNNNNGRMHTHTQRHNTVLDVRSFPL